MNTSPASSPKQKQPLVSVLMSVFNAECFLEVSLESILAQSFRNFELVVVNDASTDSSAALLERYAQRDPRLILLTNNSNLGLTKSLNRGLQSCRGKYIARQDADDLSDHLRLERQVGFMEENPDVVLLGSGYRVIDEDGVTSKTISPPNDPLELSWCLVFQNPFCHSTSMIRMDSLKRLSPPGYQPRFRYAQDFELWSRLSREGKLKTLPEHLVSWRNSSRTITATSYLKQQRFADLVVARQIFDHSGMVVGRSMVRVLRSFFFNFPRRLGREDIPVLTIMLKLLAGWAQNQNTMRCCNPVVAQWISLIISRHRMALWKAEGFISVAALAFMLHPKACLLGLFRGGEA